MPAPLPELITRLPQVRLPVDGATAHLLQGANQQLLFMEFAADLDIPPHSHAAQWGVVLAGEIELTIDGSTCCYRQGDSYFIGARVVHSARIRAGYRDISLFDQPDRYQARE